MDSLKISKQELQKVLDSFPDKINVEDFIDRIILNAKIETGLAEVERGEGMDWEDVKKEMEKW